MAQMSQQSRCVFIFFFNSMFGIIGGSNFLKSQYFADLEVVLVDTPFGGVRLRRNDRVVFCQRHHSDPVKEYMPAHLINKKAIVWAMKQMGVNRILGFGSVGSLKPAQFPPSAFVLPDDWFCISDVQSFFDDAKGHVIPKFDLQFRSEVLAVLRKHGLDPIDGGVYSQTVGPRFETKAEIRFLSAFSDVVGMTAAHEADFCNEHGLPYALICMIDNVANGLDPNKSTLELEDFMEGIRKNTIKIEKCIDVIVREFLRDKLSAELESKRDEVDLVVSARYLVPVSSNQVLHDHSLVVHQGRIVAVLPQQHASLMYRASEYIEFNDSVLMPGLVNMHTHLGMTFLRGYADDMSLIEWLTQHIWPAEGKFVSSEFVKDGSELALLEMIRCGTTCANDMYYYTEDVIEAAESAGLRLTGGLVMLDFPTGFAAGPDDYLAKAEATLDKRKGKNPLIRFSAAPHAPYTVCDDNLKRMKDFAQRHDLPVHIHLHETGAEVDDSSSGNKASMACHRSDVNDRPFHNLDRLGLVDKRLIAVHMTQLNDDEIKRCAEAGVNVVHCPSSNLKLASGMCPIGKLVAAGANVCLGTDSTASNNTLDMWSEMRTAAMLSKAVAKDPTVVPALTALRMATINGAKALGLDQEIGSLEVGKSADFIAVDMSSVEFTPVFDVLSHLVYVADRHSVSDVWVAGKRLMRSRIVSTVDQTSVLNKARQWQTKLADFHRQSSSSS